jgi:hypothetical protein
MISRPMQITLVVLVLVCFGMAFYALQLKRKAEAVQQIVDAHPAAPPTAGSRESVTAWIAHDDTGTIRQQQIQAQLPGDVAERSREILRATTAYYAQKDSPHPLPATADVHAVYLLNDGTAVVDLNGAFADGHRSGVGVEQLTVFSLVETLAANAPKVTRVRFLVDGKERDTLAGHVSLKSYYDVSTVAQLIKELQ